MQNVLATTNSLSKDGQVIKRRRSAKVPYKGMNRPAVSALNQNPSSPNLGRCSFSALVECLQRLMPRSNPKSCYSWLAQLLGH